MWIGYDYYNIYSLVVYAGARDANMHSVHERLAAYVAFFFKQRRHYGYLTRKV